MNKKLIYLVKYVGMVAMLLFISTGCNNSQEQVAQERPIAVRVLEPRISNMQSDLSYMGTLRANREVVLIAQVQGTVVAIPRSEGSKVYKNDVVAVLDVPDIRANVERLQADVDYWQNRYAADQRLVDAKALPSEQMQASLRAYRSSKAALNEAQARLAKAREYSPINGRVLSWIVEPGQHVMPGQPLLSLGNDDLEVHVEVVEEDLKRGIELGTSVTILDWQDHAYESKVSEIASVATGLARTFTVKVPLEKPYTQTSGQRIGSSVEVAFVLESKANSIIVPVNAILKQNGEESIFIVQENISKKQIINSGIEQEGWISIDLPWNGKDMVAVSNLRNLKDGGPVFPVKVKEVMP